MFPQYFDWFYRNVLDVWEGHSRELLLCFAQLETYFLRIFCNPIWNKIISSQEFFSLFCDTVHIDRKHCRSAKLPWHHNFELIFSSRSKTIDMVLVFIRGSVKGKSWGQSWGCSWGRSWILSCRWSWCQSLPVITPIKCIKVSSIKSPNSKAAVVPEGHLPIPEGYLPVSEGYLYKEYI